MADSTLLSKNELETKLLTLLPTILLFPLDLIKIIVHYCPQAEYNTQPTHIWTLPHSNSEPFGMAYDGKHIFVCDVRNSLLSYTIHGEFISAFPSLCSKPSDIIYENNKFYLANLSHIYILNSQLQLLSSFPSPFKHAYFHCLKIDTKNQYIYMSGTTSFICITNEEGKLIKQLQKNDPMGQKDGGNWELEESDNNEHKEFRETWGLTFDDSDHLYVCDCGNNRVVIFSIPEDITQKKFLFTSQWGGIQGVQDGQFHFPYSCYYSKTENIMYIGDWCSVQLFICPEGKFVQRIGGRRGGRGEGLFISVMSICPVDDKLYVSGATDGRIQVFSRK